MSQPTSFQGSGPVVRRPDTGCRVVLGSGLLPDGIRHAPPCRCVAIEAPEQLVQMATSVADAVSMGVIDSEKPSIVLAVLLLGGVHVLS
ncbi:hypothetical protein DL771_006702 [Monosporascus sp. 5C6A]|nr:hypothetical protein DL771_006702 [Monosporascus sp. 5C6A]